MSMARIWEYPCVVERVIDGDTYVLTLDLGLHIFRRESCRLLGVNAPEVSTEAGRAVREWARGRVPAGTMGVYRSQELDKYGRPLGRLVLADGTDISDELLRLGYVVEMKG